MHHRESDDGNAHVGHDGLTQMRSPKAGKATVGAVGAVGVGFFWGMNSKIN